MVQAAELYRPRDCGAISVQNRRSTPAIQHASLPLSEEARLLRTEIVRALHASGGGHYGGALSVLEILLTLYREQLRVVPEEPMHNNRDRLILSKGHAAIALYAILRRLGYFKASLEDYAQFGSILEGHPDLQSTPGVDFSTGSLGQGLSAGAGVALALRGSEQRTWVVMGDGECQEGQVWEAALFAAQYRLSQLHAVVDANGFQEWGWQRGPTLAPPPVPVSDLAAKWRSFGWRAYECDGHDPAQLKAAFDAMAATRGAPSVLLARTIKGHGVPLCEANPQRFHCGTLSAAEFASIIGGD